MNKFLDTHKLIKIHNNLGDLIRNSKESDYKVFNTRNKCYRLGIDTMLYAHKFKYSYNNIIIGFVNQIIKFLSNRILPIYIIDGIAPIEKSDLIKTRTDKKLRTEKKIIDLQNKLISETNPDKIKEINNKIKSLSRSNIKINKDDIEKLILLLQYFQIPYIRANGEADALIGILYENGSIDACLSEDMDILAFGCKKMIKFHNKRVVEYDIDFILDNLDINFNQYINMCIYFGCDYLRPLTKADPDTIYNNIYNSTMMNFIKKNVTNDIYEKYIKDFDKAKKVFKSSKKKENKNKYNFQIKKTINSENLSIFIKENTKDINNDCVKNILQDIQYINGLIHDHKFY